MSISFKYTFFKEVLGSSCLFGTNTPTNLLFNPEPNFVNSVAQSTHLTSIYFQNYKN